jgi:hypothetical protein
LSLPPGKLVRVAEPMFRSQPDLPQRANDVLVCVALSVYSQWRSETLVDDPARVD